MVLFTFISFGVLCASWTYMSIFFTKLGMISIIIFSNRFSNPCSFSSPLASLWCEYWNAWSCPRGSLHCSWFFGFLFLLAVLIGCLFLPYVPNHWFDSWIPTSVLNPCNFFFISRSVSFISDWIFYAAEVPTEFLEHPYNHLIDCLNSNRLFISILFSYFSGVLFFSFIWAIFLYLLILADFLCLFLCISYSCFDSVSW